MVDIQRIINEVYDANTYLIRAIGLGHNCYLIDIGNSVDVISTLDVSENIAAIFLTHAHYDHICGINDILQKFPDCIIYCSEYTAEALADSKLNLSFYHKTPVSYNGNNTEIISQGQSIKLSDHTVVEIIATPGHNAGSLTFTIGNDIFTGDSLIPEFPIVTKLKSGNKTEAQKSIKKIREICTPHTTIYPGHGREFQVDEVDWLFYLEK